MSVLYFPLPSKGVQSIIKPFGQVRLHRMCLVLLFVPFLTLLCAAWLPAFAASAPLGILHKLSRLLKRTVVHGQQCRVLLVRRRWKGRFASSSLLQVKVGYG